MRFAPFSNVVDSESGIYQRPASCPFVARRRDEDGDERGRDEREDQRLPAGGGSLGVKDDAGDIVDEADGQPGRQHHRTDRDIEPRGRIAACFFRKEVAPGGWLPRVRRSGFWTPAVRKR